jgi:hypothetical protein
MFQLKDKVLIKKSGFFGYVKKIYPDGKYLVAIADIIHGNFTAEELEPWITVS